jgi:NAD(P)-dependent dehydrogenase (short-subunit alcohol dehydrogenase family)
MRCIRVTALAPGQFRTDWAARSMARTPRTIPDYDAMMDPIRAARQTKSGNQPGDPAKAAQALLRLVAAEEPSVHLYLGVDALQLVTDKIEGLRAVIAAWEEVSLSTAFP